VTLANVALTLAGFTLLYTVLGVIDVILMYRAAGRGLPAGEEERPPEQPGGPAQPAAQELVY
jgi:cytochrome bd-type quinol oxidase subunit 1